MSHIRDVVLKMPRWRPMPPARYWSKCKPPTSSLNSVSDTWTPLSLEANTASFFDWDGESLAAMFVVSRCRRVRTERRRRRCRPEQGTRTFCIVITKAKHHNNPPCMIVHGAPRACRVGVVAHQQRSNCVITVKSCLETRAASLAYCPTAITKERLEKSSVDTEYYGAVCRYNTR